MKNPELGSSWVVVSMHSKLSRPSRSQTGRAGRVGSAERVGRAEYAYFFVWILPLVALCSFPASESTI